MGCAVPGRRHDRSDGAHHGAVSYGRLGQAVVVENRPGGGTNIGVQQVVNAAPDGYTLLFTVTTNAINPSLYKTMPFDFKRDIVQVSGLAELPLVLAVHPGLPAKTVAEFVTYAKANPGRSTSPRSA